MGDKNYKLRPVSTPVVKRNDEADPDVKRPDPFLRSANEDDDGYDPYSDRTEKTEFFEKNPWD